MRCLALGCLALGRVALALSAGVALAPSVAMAADNAGGAAPERGMAAPSDPKAAVAQPGDGSERAMATKPPAPGEADKDKSKERAMTK